MDAPNSLSKVSQTVNHKAGYTFLTTEAKRLLFASVVGKVENGCDFFAAGG